MDETKSRVQAQFQKTAGAYVHSAIHAKGDDLPLLLDLIQPTGGEWVLDVATGAGHTAFNFAPHVAEVVGLDLTPAMVELATAGAAERGLTNARFVAGDIDALPFPDGSFDLVTCRIAAHHFPDLHRAMHEMGRVLTKGGRCLIVDNYAPEAADLDQFINRLEWLRDRSHVRAHRLSEWGAAYRQAGLSFTVAHQFSTEMDFQWWIDRAQTPPEDVAILRTMLEGATPSVRETFGLGLDPLRFRLLKAVLVGCKT